MKRFSRRAIACARALDVCARRTKYFKPATICCVLLGLLASSPLARAASAISLAGVDFHQLCRETAHVPLVQAAIHPAYINVWSVQESRRRGRYEEYSFHTQLISVRVEHDVSLYHGLIHRTLDLIGESQWKHRDLPAHEDHEHWLIYHTLETYWPGLQRRQGGEPRPAVLATAGEYWKAHAVRYAEIVVKASALAAKSWCATHGTTLEVKASPPVRSHQPKSVEKPLLVPVGHVTERPARQAPPAPMQQPVAPTQQAAPAPTLPSAESLSTEPIWVMSDFGPSPADHEPKAPPQRQWVTSADLPMDQTAAGASWR